MQPIGNVWGKLPRVVRDLSRQFGKELRLEMEGKETELDRTILEAIKDPLTHMVRNTVDHGIEDPETRVAAGKPSEGVDPFGPILRCLEVEQWAVRGRVQTARSAEKGVPGEAFVDTSALDDVGQSLGRGRALVVAECVGLAGIGEVGFDGGEAAPASGGPPDGLGAGHSGMPEPVLGRQDTTQEVRWPRWLVGLHDEATALL